jgi:hypothetical protein
MTATRARHTLLLGSGASFLMMLALLVGTGTASADPPEAFCSTESCTYIYSPDPHVEGAPGNCGNPPPGNQNECQCWSDQVPNQPGIHNQSQRACRTDPNGDG